MTQRQWTPAKGTPTHDALTKIGLLLGRSLFPLVTFLILAGTLLWGPWISLALALLTWRLVVKFG